MRIGIVGSEAAKFTPETRDKACTIIEDLLSAEEVTAVVSGGCHLGGIDAWAAEIGRALGIEVIEHLPKTRSWEGGYKPRNMAIAHDCDRCMCITVKELPPSYTGMRFNACYHCGTNTHVKSGGCWTVKQAIKLGKQGDIIVVEA